MFHEFHVKILTYHGLLMSADIICSTDNLINVLNPLNLFDLSLSSQNHYNQSPNSLCLQTKKENKKKPQALNRSLWFEAAPAVGVEARARQMSVQKNTECWL